MTRVLLLSLLLVCGASFAQEAGSPVGDEPPGPEAAEPTSPATGDEAESAESTESTESTESAEPEPNLRTADEAYSIKVRQLESDINDLKERIFRSKAKLTLLTEQVTGGAGTGASAVISHKWEMGGAFRLTQVQYFIDGAPIWQEVDEGGKRLTGFQRKQLFDGNLVEGSHTLSVTLVLKGNGSGVFSYIDDFSWKIQDKYTFTAEPGKVHNIVVVAYEKGNFTTDLKDKPSLRFDVDVQADKKKAKSEGAKAEGDEK